VIAPIHDIEMSSNTTETI